MIITKISQAMIEGLGSSHMTVAKAQTQAALEQAMDDAGAGGTIFVPAGTYNVTGFASRAHYQTLIFQAGAKLFRTGGMHVVNVTHAGTRIFGGEFDGNKQAGDPLFRAIAASPNCGIEIHDAVIKNIAGYGVGAVDGRFIVKGCTFTAIGYISIFFQSELFRAVEPIVIEDNIVTNTGADYQDYGGIIVKTNNTIGNFLVSPILRNNRVTLPVPANTTEASTKYPNSVCIELRGSSVGVVADNTVNGGVIGVSIAKSNHAKVYANHAVSCFYYGLEAADTNDRTQFFVNTVTGSNGLAGSSCGASISNNSNNTTLVGNLMYGNLQRIRITGDCSGTTEDFVARAAGYNA
ncbi:hypothetical protein [Rhizobium sp. SGZ-381]|uniref:hypothetical protein n=1 Tax=Rhizobium sp. SGZ-381 TaxID=3342800 RepID=UPI003670A667